MDPDGRPTIREVATMAGVSRQTVSRVLNAPETVARATRQRVDRAIELLGYRPNVAARSLKQRRSTSVGLLVSENSLWFLMHVHRMGELLRERGLQLMVASVGNDSRSLDPALAVLRDAGIDGLVVASSLSWLVPALQREKHLGPVVFMQHELDPASGVSSVAVDLTAGVRALVAHFVQTGRTRLAHVAAPASSRTGEQRVAAWAAALREAGLEELPVIPGGWRGDDGYRAAEAVKRLRPEGVLAANDLCAMGMIRGLGRLGVLVPQDVGVAGVDDWIGSDQFIPPLTTLRTPVGGLCETAVTLLGELLAGEGARAVTLPAELVVRASTDYRL